MSPILIKLIFDFTEINEQSCEKIPKVNSRKPMLIMISTFMVRPGLNIYIALMTSLKSVHALNFLHVN